MVKFQIDNISTLQFAILEENRPADFSSMNVEVDVRIEGNPKNTSIAAQPIIRLSDETGKTLLVIQVSCSVKLAEDSWKNYIKVTDASLLIPKDIALHILVITIGTVRGILFEKCEQTQYRGLVLPALDLTALVIDDPLVIAGTK